MKPLLGEYAFAPWRLAVREQQRVVQGQLRRTIEIKGASDAFGSEAEAERALDQTVGAALAPEPLALRLRPGRSLCVRFAAFARERQNNAGAFTLELAALSAWEEADEPRSRSFVVDELGVVGVLDVEGALAAPLIVDFTASGTVMAPRFGDGQEWISYDGLVPAGSTLRLDGCVERAYLDGEDVTEQVDGACLLARPGGAPLFFNADPEGSHSGLLTFTWRERWL